MELINPQYWASNGKALITWDSYDVDKNKVGLRTITNLKAFGVFEDCKNKEKIFIYYGIDEECCKVVLACRSSKQYANKVWSVQAALSSFRCLPSYKFYFQEPEKV